MLGSNDSPETLWYDLRTEMQPKISAYYRLCYDTYPISLEHTHPSEMPDGKDDTECEVVPCNIYQKPIHRSWDKNSSVDTMPDPFAAIYAPRALVLHVKGILEKLEIGHVNFLSCINGTANVIGLPEVEEITEGWLFFDFNNFDRDKLVSLGEILDEESARIACAQEIGNMIHEQAPVCDSFAAEDMLSHVIQGCPTLRNNGAFITTLREAGFQVTRRPMYPEVRLAGEKIEALSRQEFSAAAAMFAVAVKNCDVLKGAPVASAASIYLQRNLG